MRDPRYDILFEPLKIGPVTAKNRFYQVPHCNGGGYRDPSAAAEMRRTKSEGGWGVIFTEQTEMHHTSEITPFIELRLWDDADIPALAKMAKCMHEYGALAGVQLAYSGINGPNLYTKEVPRGPSALPIRTFTNDPVQARAMDKQDIRDLRRWHRNAFKRARQAGFDLVCLYGAHGFGIIQHFLSTATNQRTDEYGGSLENRSRLMRELIEEGRDAIGDTCGLTLRLSLDEMIGELGFANSEVRDMIEMHADLPDLWDLAHGAWEDCSGPSRFKEEAAQESLVSGIKKLTSKPVVGVGRFTSPDVMVRMIKSGTLDFIGCARPSIADPFLPKKVEEGRIEDIRECIGCNICVSSHFAMTNLRCTQNPTMGEEWRRGWHPEKIAPKTSDASILVVGAGPSGLECARALGQRGYRVTLAEGETYLGGRVSLEGKLPGLGEWQRVRDWRVTQLHKLANVDIYLGSSLSAADVRDFGADHVVLATGSTWRSDGVGRAAHRPQSFSATMPLFTPDDIMRGRLPQGDVVVYDDDHYYMGAVIAEKLALSGCRVTLVTPAADISAFTVNTLENLRTAKRLHALGIAMATHQALAGSEKDEIAFLDARTGAAERRRSDALVLVTARLPNDALFRELAAGMADDGHCPAVSRIGDCEAPAAIFAAVYSGHRFARDFENAAPVFRRERIDLHA